VVKPPWSNPADIDPEEAYVAALSSCHMLTFLYVAGRHGYIVDTYDAAAVGIVSKNERGIPWVSAVRLNPRITYSGQKHPSTADLAHLHHQAHEHCFIANSVKTDVTVGPI
jgi:organic hydroperoxide reductase OsmC/OhrA